MGVYVQKQHTPAQLAALQRRVVDTIIAGKPPHGFNMRAFHSQPPKGSELDWFVGRHLYYHMRAADRGDLLTGGPMQRLRRVRLRSEGEVAGEGEGEYFLARDSMADEAGATLVSSWEARQRQAGAAAPMNQLGASRPADDRAVVPQSVAKLTPSEGGRISSELHRAAQLSRDRIAAATLAVTGTVLAVDEAARRVDVLLDTGGVREGVPASDVAATLSGEACVAEQDLTWVSFCDSEVRLAAMRALGFARTQELGRQLAQRGEVVRVRVRVLSLTLTRTLTLSRTLTLALALALALTLTLTLTRCCAARRCSSG